MSLKWAINGVLDDIYFMAQGLPRLLFTWKPENQLSILNFFEKNVKKYPNEIAFVFKDRSTTWQEADKKVSQYGAYLQSQGIEKGDCFALLMDNSADFLMLLLAAHRIGAIAALINTTVTGEGLKHVVTIVDAKAAVLGASHLEKFESSMPEAELQSLKLFLVEDSMAVPEGYTDINIAAQSAGEVVPHPLKIKDVAMYIYTSGTTGLPKAALITNGRAVKTSYAGQFFGFKAKQKDVLYLTLPLYHATGLLWSWAGCLRAGATTVIKEKFSASEFWPDVRKHKATMFGYVGELCRYLMNVPPNDDDQNHQLQVISGNGLRPDIWEKFQTRFNIPKIRELYGATEGVGALVNTHGRPGMVGRYMRGSLVVKCDLESGEPIRNSEGYCESVEIGETGLFISKLSKLATFEGYLDKQASNKKIMADVMEDGDAWFNSGDLLTRHENNWLSFADRVGDTYRWKSENVSTMEVAAIINKYPEVLDSNVYGVEVESADGRAGMALMNVTGEFDFEVFSEHVEKNLNAFQRPCFVRIAEEMKTTGTFKHQKEDLKKQGFDPAAIEDKLYFYQKGNYVEIDDSLYQRIQSGEERF
ncbi:long-chain-acyl-CoA synthetase [Gammaproteobacteria bacterium]|nr:long-chain-acyl-CoA synthetase [Gammaproteobacteria bacterium]